LAAMPNGQALLAGLQQVMGRAIALERLIAHPASCQAKSLRLCCVLSKPLPSSGPTLQITQRP
jgi:hypothetical protein